MEENSKNDYGHAQPEALFPLFKSDLEYELIKAVIQERFKGVQKEIHLMYKYLASQHMPKFVIFSEVLPYGIVIKKLPPDRAWSEVFCDKTLRQFHFYKFYVKYHISLGCISERYMYGYDIHELPERILSDEMIIQKIFYWLGKCAAVAYVFGIGDRGHNERINISETNNIEELYSYSWVSEPIINIDFETFPSRRLVNIYVDVDEVGLPFYAVIRQVPRRFRTFIDYYYSLYKRGFMAKMHFIKQTWRINYDEFLKALELFFIANPNEKQGKIIREIRKRANGKIDNSIFDEAIYLIKDSLEKAGRFESSSKADSIKELRRHLREKHHL